MNEDIKEKVLKCTENKIEQLLEQDITEDMVGYLYKLVDIHKDIENENYWKEKIMRYRNYRGRDGDELPNMPEEYYNDSYGRRMRDSRGRYMESSYGRRYRGEDYLDDMSDNYRNYETYRERYGTDDNETMKSYRHMIKSFKDFGKHIKQEAISPEQMEMFEETAREMLER